VCVCVCVCVRVCVRARACEKLGCKLGKHFRDFQLLNQGIKRFTEGRMTVGKDPRPGRPSTSTNDDHVVRARAVIRGYCRLAVREVADEVGLSTRSCFQIFIQKRQMHRVSAKFVPRLFGVQKENRYLAKHQTSVVSHPPYSPH
jgi:hypothetical protein